MNAKTVKTQAFIDCWAGGMFIDQNFAQNFEILSLNEPITARNIDGTINKKGTIKSYVKLKFRERFYIMGLGKQKIILGFTWLQKYNPLIDWKTGKIEWKDWKFNFRKWFGKPTSKLRTTMEEHPDKEENKNQTLYPTNEDLNAILLERERHTNQQSHHCYGTSSWRKLEKRGEYQQRTNSQRIRRIPGRL